VPFSRQSGCDRLAGHGHKETFLLDESGPKPPKKVKPNSGKQMSGFSLADE
jgi:hypothetical protein